MTALRFLGFKITCFPWMLFLWMSFLLFSLSAAPSVILREWSFETLGDNEGWTAQTFVVNNLKVAAAVDGSSNVLTCQNLQNQADIKLNFPSGNIALPENVIGWGYLELRIRQIGVDGVTPVAFDNLGTIAMYKSPSTLLPWGNVNPIPTSTNLGATLPVTVTVQSNQWLLISWDLRAYTSGEFPSLTRLDPVTGTDMGGGVIAGNFEIDYVTLSYIPRSKGTVLRIE